MAEKPFPASPSSRRSGVPNRAVLDAAQSRFRAALAKLSRDPDTREQAGLLAVQAAKALDALSVEANAVEEASPKHRARMERLERRVAYRFGQLGRPLPAALQRPEERP